MSKSEYIFKGVFIPAFVWKNEELSPTQKMLLCEIDAMSDGENNPCYAGNEHFAKHLKCSVKSISNMIGYFVKLGYLKRTFTNEKTFEGRKMWTDFSVIPTPPSENATPPSENATPPSENGTINKPINSLKNKPLKNSTASQQKKKKISFNSFRELFFNSIYKDSFTVSSLDTWSSTTKFRLTSDMMIFNTVSAKLLPKDEAYQIWSYLYEKYLNNDIKGL